jgi:hypothetical protein
MWQGARWPKLPATYLPSLLITFEAEEPMIGVSLIFGRDKTQDGLRQNTGHSQRLSLLYPHR